MLSRAAQVHKRLAMARPHLETTRKPNTATTTPRRAPIPLLVAELTDSLTETAYGNHNTANGEHSFAGAFAGKYGYARGSYNTATGAHSFAGAQTGGGYKYTGGTAIARGNTANGAYSFAGAYTFAHGQYGGNPYQAVASRISGTLRQVTMPMLGRSVSITPTPRTTRQTAIMLLQAIISE